MYLLYLDASGTPELQDVNSKHYVLVGVCMHESAWFDLDKRLQSLKRNYCVTGEEAEHFEIHVKQFAGTITEQDAIPEFEQMSRAERRAAVLTERQK